MLKLNKLILVDLPTARFVVSAIRISPQSRDCACTEVGRANYNDPAGAGTIRFFCSLTDAPRGLPPCSLFRSRELRCAAGLLFAFCKICSLGAEMAPTTPGTLPSANCIILAEDPRLVGASRIQILSKDCRIPFFAAPEVRSVDHPWAGYDFEESLGDGVPLPSHSWSKTTLLYVREGSSSLRWKHRGVWSHDPIERGTVSIVRRDVEIQAAVPGGSFPMMVLQLDNTKLQHLAPAQISSIDETLVGAQVTKDARLGNLLSAMRAEVKDGCRSGRLYAEAISIALLAYLANKYCASRRDASETCLLSQSQRRRIDDYIRQGLGDNISVGELASLVHMSPSYFSRVFKASFGETPYHFVMRQRIEAAKAMLADPNLTATGIASALGFASQSHFVKVFRQFTNVTPGRYRMDAKLPF